MPDDGFGFNWRRSRDLHLLPSAASPVLGPGVSERRFENKPGFHV